MSVSVECNLGDANLDEEVCAAAHRVFDDLLDPWHVTARKQAMIANLLVESRGFNRAARLSKPLQTVSNIENLFVTWASESRTSFSERTTLSGSLEFL